MSRRSLQSESSADSNRVQKTPKCHVDKGSVWYFIFMMRRAVFATRWRGSVACFTWTVVLCCIGWKSVHRVHVSDDHVSRRAALGHQSPWRRQQPQEAVHAILPLGLHEDCRQCCREWSRRPTTRPVSPRFSLSFSISLWLCISINPLTPTAAIWVQLESVLCQIGLSRHL